MGHIPPKTTRELSQTLASAQNRSDLDRYIGVLPEQVAGKTFSDYYNALPKVREIPAAELIRRAGIDRTYGYQILNGTRRNPGKDKILRFALAAALTPAETQRALEIAEAPVLYPRNRRDAILLFSLNRKLNVMDTNELLDQFGEEALG
ncbi:XRE family transcriptional regulator [Eubacterium pyruvativorans]|uniref:XRE family transcriptional regulator n=1 Tax=Eubacterium pyruvativorans TaxID=155865 RepID=UPI00156472F9|nr:XRE family transcriptional regulator [Eubacterium pyruvativorans]